MHRFRLVSLTLASLLLGVLLTGGSTSQPVGAYATQVATGRADRPSPTPGVDSSEQPAVVDIAPDAPVDALAGISVGTGGVPATQKCTFVMGVDDPGMSGALRELDPTFLSFQANQPTICSDGDLSGAGAFLVPPGGAQSPLAQFTFLDTDQGQTRYGLTLPLAAYMQPGIWRFGIRQPVAVDQWVKIPAPVEPFFMRGHTDTSLVGGFQPNEMVKAVAYTFQGNADNGLWVYAGVVTFQVGANGYWLLNVPNSRDISFVLIGQQRSFVLANARFDNNGTTSLPSRDQWDTLYQAYWGSAGSSSGPEVTPATGNIQLRSDNQGVAQVLVPNGCFPMGSANPNDLSGQIKDRSQRQVCLTRDYWLDQYEVSNASYQRFVDAGGYQTQAYWSSEGWQWLLDNGRQGPTDYPGFTDPQQPRVGVSLYEAQAYARWRGGRIPTEAEWEYAARGPQSLLYPWGNSFEDGRANVKGVAGRPVNVDSYPNGRSWVGAFNLAGNVGEWVSDCDDSGYDNLRVQDNPVGPCNGSNEVVKGSSWAFNQYPAQANYRFVNPPLKFWYDVGIRVVSN
jgi:formylglycine-generating enzyme required for sulfatase activity